MKLVDMDKGTSRRESRFRGASPGRLRQRRATPASGFTLVEVLLAISITVLIAASVSAMIFSTSYGTSRQTELRHLLVFSDLVSSRLGAAVGTSRAVLATGQNYIVLWVADTVAGGQVNVSEMRRIERNPATNELYLYQAPTGLPEAQDVSYDRQSTDFNAVTTALKSSASFPARLLATDVTAMTLTLNNASVQAATVVSHNITTTLNGASETTVGEARLKNH